MNQIIFDYFSVLCLAFYKYKCVDVSDNLGYQKLHVIGTNIQIYQTESIQSWAYLDILGYSLALIPLTVYPIAK